jgi:methyl-accepting chemotaxis protein
MTVGLAFAYNAWLEMLFIGIPCIALPLFLLKAKPWAESTHHVVALSMLAFVALHLQQAQGLTELHFGFFVILAMLVLYLNWRVLLTAVLFIAVHHLSFFIMQLNAVPVFVFESDRIGISIFLVHAAYAVIEGLMVGYVANQNKHVELASSKISDTIVRISAQENSIDLTERASVIQGNIYIERFNALLDNMQNLSCNIGGLSGNLRNQSEQMDELSAKLYSIKQDSFGEVENIASVMDSLSSSVNHAAASANHANEKMSSMASDTADASSIMGEANSTNQQVLSGITIANKNINELSSACEEITGILGDISGIADQTNLLALNAAIEAARAGEHGRGFAVVADEVRQLAQRTTESTGKIDTMMSQLLEQAKKSVTSMNESVERVGQSNEKTDEANKLIAKINDSIKQCADLNKDVARAMDAQAKSSTDMATAIQHVKQLSSDENSQVTLIQKQAKELNHAALQVNEEVSHLKC